MKRVIRPNCFESNSSSAHVLLVTKDDRKIGHDVLTADYSDDNYDPYNSVYIDPKGKLILWDVEYGYDRGPFKILSSFNDKLKYSLCEYLGCYYGDEPEFDEKYHEIENIVKNIIPEMTEFYTHTNDIDIYLDRDGNELLHRQLEYDHWNEKTGSSEYTYTDKDGKKFAAILDKENYLEVPAIGNIDHQSAGLLKYFLHEKEISLEEFLTNRKYLVVIDGDEYNAFQELKATGLINLDFIVEEYDRSGEDVEYQEWLKKQEDLKNEKNDTE